MKKSKPKIIPDDDPPLPAQNGEDATGSLSRDPSDPAVDRGRQTPEIEGDDEEQIFEKLVEDGVEIAEDEQLDAGKRRPRNG